MKIWDTIKDYWGRYKGYAYAIGVFLAIAGLVWVVNDYRDTRALALRQGAEISTLSTEFKRIGDSVVAQGGLLRNEAQAWREASALQGKQLTDAMRDQNAQIRAVFEAQARVMSEVIHNQSTSGGVTPQSDGSFKAARMTQGRSGPALTEVSLNYDPKNPDPTKRLLGDWSNYREDFFPSVIEWGKADKGFSGTFRLRREIYRSDGSLVGKEEIPITTAKASFDPDTLPGRPLSVPRLTVSAGAAWDWQKKSWGPVFMGDYRVSNTWGLGAGFAGNQVLMTTSFRFNGFK